MAKLNKAASLIRRKNLVYGTIDKKYLNRKFKEISFGIFFYSLVIGLCFSILYPLLKILPQIFCDFENLGNPDVIWIPITPSLLSLKAAIRLNFTGGSPLYLTILYCLSITFIQILISSFAGYSLARVNFPFRNIVMALVIITIVVPPQALLISQYLLFKPFDIFGIIAHFTGKQLDLIGKPYTLYILAATGFGVRQGIFVFIFRQFFHGIPNEIEEAALMDGCGFYKTFFRVTLPTAVPAIITVATLSFVWNYGDIHYTGYFDPNGPYLANKLSLFFAGHNMEYFIDTLQYWYRIPYISNFTYDAVKYASSLIFMIPLFVLFLIIQKHIVENFEKSGIVG